MVVLTSVLSSEIKRKTKGIKSRGLKSRPRSGTNLSLIPALNNKEAKVQSHEQQMKEEINTLKDRVDNLQKTVEHIAIKLFPDGNVSMRKRDRSCADSSISQKKKTPVVLEPYFQSFFGLPLMDSIEQSTTILSSSFPTSSKANIGSENNEPEKGTNEFINCFSTSADVRVVQDSLPSSPQQHFLFENQQ
jgi:hypothetical protein